MKIHSRILPAIILLFAATGCTTLYKPNAVHSPMLTQKGDDHISAALGVTGSGLANVQAGVAVTDHIGIIADGMYHYRSMYQTDYYDTSRTEKLNIYSIGGGLGYFEKLGYNQKTVLQLYGGAAYGKSKASKDHYENPEPHVDAEFVEGYVQPGLVFLNRYVNMSVDVRIKYVQLYNISSYRYNEFDWYDNDESDFLGRRLDFILCDPSFSLRTGGKHLKGLIQAGFHIPVMNAEGYFRINSSGLFFDPFVFFNIGMSYTFGKAAVE